MARTLVRVRCPRNRADAFPPRRINTQRIENLTLGPADFFVDPRKFQLGADGTIRCPFGVLPDRPRAGEIRCAFIDEIEKPTVDQRDSTPISLGQPIAYFRPRQTEESREIVSERLLRVEVDARDATKLARQLSLLADLPARSASSLPGVATVVASS
jgi:hypothetical protein